MPSCRKPDTVPYFEANYRGAQAFLHCSNDMEEPMMKKKMIALAAAGLLAGASTVAFAQTSPGLQMQEKGSVKGSPGASGYAPGQQMQEKGSVKGTTGASGYAPGHATTGTSVKGGANADVNGNGAKANAGVKANGNVK
jgi:hypothetical protein